MNLELYNKYKDVPSNALKAFNNGSFKGTDINTMWRIRCLTEEFGPCGIGWYFDIIKQWTEDGADNEVMCFAEIKLYYQSNGEWSKGISATGGSKLIQYFSSKDYVKTNDEGYKMAITDALGVSCKYLGIGASVYWSNDKTKYTNNDTPNKEYKKPVFEQKSPPKVQQNIELNDAENYVLTFGKHAGKKLGTIEIGYIEWLSENAKDDNLAFMAKSLLEARLDSHKYPPETARQEFSVDDGDLPF